jgi:Ser/Thr protein kinase RdoA (MazF antagonist)
MFAPDAAVPHRDALLDERVVARLLSGRLLADPVDSCRCAYVKYRVGESLRVVYKVGPHYVAGRGFAPGASDDAYRRAIATAVPAPPMRSVVHVPELDAVFWAFPNDRRLTTLPLLAGRSGTLDRLVGSPRVTPRLVAYCAERSASAECAGEDGSVLAFAKIHAGDGAERERHNLLTAQAADGGRLRVPRVIGTSALDGALAVEAVAGRRLDTLPADELPAALHLLGAALATLHERAPLPETRFRRLDVERLAKAVGVIARARPDAGPAAAALLTRLLDRRDDAAGPPVALHGDANLRNAILERRPRRGERVTLIDFEDASAGPAAADLGQVMARLRANPVAGAERALLDGYATVRPAPDAAALRWHTGASVLARLALPAISRVRPPILGRLRELLETA